MIRARFVFAAALAGVSLVGTASAQAPAAPDFQPILAGKDFKPPIRGLADIDYVKPPVKRVKDVVVDEFTVKNTSSSPIARLTIESIYYDKGGAVIGGGRGIVTGLLKPGEVQTIRVETPFSPQMNSSNYKFSHANGSITPKKVDKVVDPAAAEKAAAAKAAAAARR